MMIWAVVSALTGLSAGAITPDAAGRANLAPVENKAALGSRFANTQTSQSYSAIVDRNVFNLHPPPPPVDPSESAKNKNQIPKLTLNGITTILGKKMVILTMPATKPGGAPQTLMLAEGQGEDEVEAKQIDEKAGVVQVNNHGEAQTLDFDHDGTKPAAPPGNPASPAMTIPPVPNTTIPIPQPGINMIRPLRTLPSRPAPLSGNLPPMNSEQQALTIEAQRMKYMQDGDPTAKILPPTDHTQEVIDEMNQNPATQ